MNRAVRGHEEDFQGAENDLFLDLSGSYVAAFRLLKIILLYT